MIFSKLTMSVGASLLCVTKAAQGNSNIFNWVVKPVTQADSALGYRGPGCPGLGYYPNMSLYGYMMGLHSTQQWCESLPTISGISMTEDKLRDGSYLEGNGQSSPRDSTSTARYGDRKEYVKRKYGGWNGKTIRNYMARRLCKVAKDNYTGEARPTLVGPYLCSPEFVVCENEFGYQRGEELKHFLVWDHRNQIRNAAHLNDLLQRPTSGATGNFFTDHFCKLDGVGFNQLSGDAVHAATYQPAKFEGFKRFDGNFAGLNWYNPEKFPDVNCDYVIWKNAPHNRSVAAHFHYHIVIDCRRLNRRRKETRRIGEMSTAERVEMLKHSTTTTFKRKDGWHALPQRVALTHEMAEKQAITEYKNGVTGRRGPSYRSSSAQSGRGSSLLSRLCICTSRRH